MFLVRFFVSVLPLFFPLYTVRFDFCGVPFSLPEILLYTALVIYVYCLIFGGQKFLRLPRWTFFMNILLLLVCFLAVWGLPKEVVFEGQAYQTFAHGVGIFKEWIFAPIVYFFLLRQVASGEQAQETLRRAFLLGASGLAVYALLFGAVSDDGRLMAHFSNPNYLALYLTPAFWLALTHFYYGERKRGPENIFYIFVLGLAIFLTRSYTSWLALLATALIYIFTTLKGFKRWYFLGILLLCGLLAFGYEINSEKFTQIFDLQERSSTAVRLQIWQVALELWRAHPWLGVGLGMFQLEYWQHAWEILGQAPYEWNILHTHNLYLQWLVTTGAIGLLVFLVWVISIFRYRPLNRWLDPRFIFILILIQGFWDLPLWKNDLAFVFFFVAGLVASGHHTMTSRVYAGSLFNSFREFEVLSLNPNIARHLDGVYAVEVRWKGQRIPAIAFSGANKKGERKFEVHLFGLEVDLRGEKVDVSVIERIRDTMQFESKKDLKEQILEDYEDAKQILKLQ